jgi:aminopeptidase
MIDPRMKKLADLLIGYSCSVQPGEKVLVDVHDVPAEMAGVMVQSIVNAGGLPFVEVNQSRVLRDIYRNATEEQVKALGKRDVGFLSDMQCYITLRGGPNITELSDVPEDRMNLVQEHWQKPVWDHIMNHTKWTTLRWPTSSMAQLAGMSTDAFEDFYFDVCTLDYAKMARAVKPLMERMDRTDRVRIEGPLDTSISFSIKNIPASSAVGNCNVPDGEVWSAPVLDSVNGVIHFNTGTCFNGKNYDDIRLVYKAGKIIEGTSSDTKSLNETLDMDEGARYTGEFAFGINPHIHRAMRDILFDEKIAGSIHLTPGNAYVITDNGNRSKVHWDMVLIQTPEFGGGEIWFDDELIRKDGRFVPDYLQCLNPENLV